MPCGVAKDIFIRKLCSGATLPSFVGVSASTTPAAPVFVPASVALNPGGMDAVVASAYRFSGCSGRAPILFSTSFGLPLVEASPELVAACKASNTGIEFAVPAVVARCQEAGRCLAIESGSAFLGFGFNKKRRGEGILGFVRSGFLVLSLRLWIVGNHHGAIEATTEHGLSFGVGHTAGSLSIAQTLAHST